jgi:hypothetical protein
VNSLKIIIASLLAGTMSFLTLYFVAPWVSLLTYWGVLIQGSVAGLIGVLVYLASGWILGLSEAHNLFKLLRSTASKIGRPINIIWNWMS